MRLLLLETPVVEMADELLVLLVAGGWYQAGAEVEWADASSRLMEGEEGSLLREVRVV